LKNVQASLAYVDAIRTPSDKEAHFSQEESDIHIS